MLWSLIPPQLKVGAALVVVALALVAGTIVYNRVYDRGYQAAVAVAEREKAKQRAANEAAIEASRQTLHRQLSELVFNNSQVEQNVSELDAQADADPAGDRIGLTAGSVRRVDSVH